jgi:acyl-coenzyme A synthetase/AMP-(fatty) acid ligase
MRSFENINEETLKNGYSVMSVKWASSTWQTDIVNAAVKQKREKKRRAGWEWNSYCCEEEFKHFTKSSDH